jgi:transcriptional regulator with XRE-family HTH domain
VTVTTETFPEALRRLRSARGFSLRDLGQLVNYSRQYVWDLECGRRQPHPELADILDRALDAGGKLAVLATPPHPDAALAADEADAYELADRVAASDVSDTTLTGLERAFDRLAIAYQGTKPADLLPDVRRNLRHVSALIDKRATLANRRRLVVVGGWLSLLGATLHIDLHQRGAAAARLDTAASLADHAGDREISAWCLETQAWDALTEGRFRLAVDLSQAAQDVAPRDGSAFIQATAQEGRAHARLGDRRATRGALDRVARLVSPLPQPDQPEHHYRYDPAKQVAYTATTLSWIADPAAEGYAREVVARLDGGGDGGPRPRRAASARLDLAKALLAAGRADEAAGEALDAIGSGRIVPSNAWRAGEIVTAVEAAGLSERVDLREAYETLRRGEA